jgi:hypothetical protein
MSRNRFIAVALGIVLSACAGVGARAGVLGPGPWFERAWVWGNDTGGIIPYMPQVRGIYREMAADFCAHWGRLSHITSVHAKYGDYIGFVCIDRPGVIH